MSLLGTVLGALWAMLPAYVPNNAAVLFGGGRPLDGGRNLGERRILGDGKTWRGTVAGIGAGVLVAGLLNVVRERASDAVGLPTAGDPAETLPSFPPRAALVLPAGAMLGDTLASFLKRRTGRERGAAFPLVDQLDFVTVAVTLTALLVPDWFEETFTPARLLVVTVVTPALHLLANGAAYLLGLKDEPW
ncbi:MAG: CDP-2,3-bis-(O-geranylgeranyl)-sn-glycerol synthase [Haloglomus sp.]